MIGYLIRRVGQAVMALWVVLTVVFILLKVQPGNVAYVVLGRSAYPANVAAFDRANGLDQSVIVQYWRFLDSVLHGQVTFAPPNVQTASTFIQGYAQGVSLQELAEIPLRNTMILMGLSFVVAVPLGLLAGTWLGLRRGPVRAAVRVGVGAVYAIPSFFLGLIVLVVFSEWTRILPDNFPEWGLGDVLSEPLGLVAPALTLALANAAMIARYAETATMECLQTDYVRTAWAKGASPTRVVLHHVARNSGVTILTVLQLRLALMFSIALPVEVLFNYPGLLQLTWQAATARDSYTVLAATVLVGIVVIVLSLIVDVLYVVLDPRIRYVSRA